MAGIRNYKGNEFMNNQPLLIREGVDLFKNDTLLFQPGKNYAYTSYSLNLLSLVMEEATGFPFEDYVQTKVLKPLAMYHTIADKKQELKDKATFYLKSKHKKFKEAPGVDNYFKLAGGGYLSTSEDIVKLGNAYLQGSFLPQKVQAEFVTTQYIDEQKTYYGVGWQSSFDHRGRPFYGHVGNGLGGYSIFYVCPEENVVVSILVNSSNPNIDKKFNQVIDAVFQALDKV